MARSCTVAPAAEKAGSGCYPPRYGDGMLATAHTGRPTRRPGGVADCSGGKAPGQHCAARHNQPG
eukprot:3914562-Rhodomonas_salina.1